MKNLKWVEEIIKLELNVEEVIWLDSDEHLVTTNIKPNYKAISAVYGKNTTKVGLLIGSLSEEEQKQLVNGKSVSVSDNFTIYPEFVSVIKTPVHSGVVTDGMFTIELDTTIDERLKQKGLAQEFIRLINNCRKDFNLSVSDNIIVYYVTSPNMEQLLDSHSNEIVKETKCLQMEGYSGSHEHVELIHVDEIIDNIQFKFTIRVV